MQRPTFLFFMLLVNSLFAQKVDLDKFHFKVNYQRLPKEYVPYENRTYGVRVKTGGAINNYTDENTLYNRMSILGWKKVEMNPTVGIDLNLDDFTFRSADLKSEVNQTKDKDNRVISSTTSYWMEARYSVRGNGKIKGPLTPREPSQKVVESQKKKEEAIAQNRFLKQVTLTKKEETPLDGVPFNFVQEVVYNSEKSSDSRSVQLNFNNNKDAIYQAQLRVFVDGAVNSMNNRANDLYGFIPISTTDYLWILDSKTHPEGQTQLEAIQAVKVLFENMKADQPLKETQENFQPLIDYFNSIKTKYTSNEKADRKMRYSSYYNLSKIYYYLDQPDKAIQEAEGLIKNGFDEKDGEGLIKQATLLKEEFQATKYNSRHNEPLK